MSKTVKCAREKFWKYQGFGSKLLCGNIYLQINSFQTKGKREREKWRIADKNGDEDRIDNSDRKAIAGETPDSEPTALNSN